MDFRHLADSSPVPTVVLDRDWRFVYANPAAEGGIGRVLDELVGLYVWDVFPETRDTPFWPHHERAMAERTTEEWEAHYPPHDRWYAVRAQGHADGLYITFVDVTDTKHAERALRQSEAELREFADAMPHMMWVSHPEGGVIHYNRRFFEYTGLTAEDARGLGWQQTIHPDDLPDCLSSRQEALRAVHPWRCEYRLRRHDGAWRWHVGRAVPLLNEQGCVTKWVGSATDVHEEVEARSAREAEAARQAHIAASLQRSLLLLPPARAFPGVEVEAVYHPASDEALVSGDFADVFALDGGKVACVVGDIGGKGLVAATYTAEVMFALRALLHEHLQPTVALERLNRFLLDGQRSPAASEQGADAPPLVALALAVIDPATGRTLCSAAGAEPPLVLRDATGTAEEIGAGGPILGVEADTGYTAGEVFLARGDALLLNSDGVSEARDAATGAFFGTEGVMHTAVAAMSRRPEPMPLRSVAEAVVACAREFTGGRLRDDACVLLARRI